MNETESRYFEQTRTELGDGVFVKVKDFNENEPATCVELALLLETSWLKRLLVVPLLSILTLLIFPLKLYWSPRWRANWFYRRATGMHNATNVFIVGRGKKFFMAVNFKFRSQRGGCEHCESVRADDRAGRR